MQVRFNEWIDRKIHNGMGELNPDVTMLPYTHVFDQQDQLDFRSSQHELL